MFETRDKNISSIEKDIALTKMVILFLSFHEKIVVSTLLKHLIRYGLK